MPELGKRKCQICVGCGRCANKGDGLQIVTESFLREKPLTTEKSVVEGFFVVVDIGTTTIAMELYDMDGRKQEEYVCANPQRVFGADVISRIQAAENVMIARQMRAQVTSVIMEGLKKFTESAYEVERIYIAGNTTMMYLLCGHDVQPLGYAPFQADFLQGETVKIGEFVAETLPGLSAFVGGDVVAGILACGMHRTQEISLLVDLGTNGEVVLGNGDKLLASSTAAGPAFEGMVQAEGKAVWGADMVAAVAELLKQGILDETGLLEEPYFSTGVTIGGVSITEDHIRCLQAAKAAVAAAIQALISEYGLKCAEEIDKVYLAGGFGYFLKEEGAVRIGLLPQGLQGKMQAVGNSALAGAYAYHFRPQAKRELEQIKNITRVVNLAQLDSFTSNYVEHMYLKPV